jgi:hypothetical protein
MPKWRDAAFHEVIALLILAVKTIVQIQKRG